MYYCSFPIFMQLKKYTHFGNCPKDIRQSQENLPKHRHQSASTKIPTEIMLQTAFSNARKSFNMKGEFALPVLLLYSYERLFFCSRTLPKHALSPLHQRLGLYTNKKKRFFLTVYSNATLFCQSFPRRVPSNNSEGYWDGRRSKSSDLYQQHMQWNKKLPKNCLFRFCSYMLT